MTNATEREVADAAKVRGTPADVAHSPKAQATENIRTGRAPAKPVPNELSMTIGRTPATDDEIIALRTEHGAEEAGTKLANDPRFKGLSKTERTNAIRSLAKDEAGLLPASAQRTIDQTLAKMQNLTPDQRSVMAKAYLAKAPNAVAYKYIAKQMKQLGLLVDEE